MEEAAFTQLVNVSTERLITFRQVLVQIQPPVLEHSRKAGVVMLRNQRLHNAPVVEWYTRKSQKLLPQRLKGSSPFWSTESKNGNVHSTFEITVSRELERKTLDSKYSLITCIQVNLHMSAVTPLLCQDLPKTRTRDNRRCIVHRSHKQNDIG